MQLHSFEEILDRDLGVKGTPERDEFERKVAEDVRAYKVGEAIKSARLKQHLTQDALGEKVGVKKSQISKLENGRGVITLPTMSRVFRALGFKNGALDLGGGHRVALW